MIEEVKKILDELIDQEDDESLAILSDKIADQIEQQDCIKTREDAELLSTLVVYSHFTDYLVEHDEELAKQILSHHDLALIVRRGCKGFEHPQLQNHYVIPLAEALGGKE